MKYMEFALSEAKKAFMDNEVPVGCVIVKDNNVIASAHNTTISDMNDTHHAEINAINEAIARIGDKNLMGCDMYVTLEPCPMCAGAIINTKIKRIYIGADEPKSGCFGSAIDFNIIGFNHKPEIYHGICEEECKTLMKDYFKCKR